MNPFSFEFLPVSNVPFQDDIKCTKDTNKKYSTNITASYLQCFPSFFLQYIGEVYFWSIHSLSTTYERVYSAHLSAQRCNHYNFIDMRIDIESAQMYGGTTAHNQKNDKAHNPIPMYTVIGFCFYGLNP